MSRLPTILVICALSLVFFATCGERQRTTGQTVTPISDQPSTSGSITPEPTQEQVEMVSNRIAYMGAEGNIFIINPDGTDPRKLTSTDLRVKAGGGILARNSSGTRVSYSWPTWSHDGTKLAASRTVLTPNQAEFSVEVIDTSTGETSRIYRNELNTIPIAPGAPHYLYWAPDSHRLTFIASSLTQLGLYLSAGRPGREPELLAGQGPLYFSWAKDGTAILIHRGGDLLFATASDEGVGPLQALGQTNSNFNAPALNQDGSKLVYTTSNGDVNSLYVAQPGRTLSLLRGSGIAEATPILEVGGMSGFLWSPTRDEVAVADAEESVWPPIWDRLRVVSSDGTSERTLVDEPMLAFFWSPDGDKIVYVAFGNDREPFTWKYVDTAGGSPIELVRFFPSPEYMTLLLFFDQYAHSNSIWSPDSSQITFSGIVVPADFAQNGALPSESRVYVMDVKEGTVPRDIATSPLAVWSWN